MPHTTDQARGLVRLTRLPGILASLVWWSLLTVLVLLALYAGLGRQLSHNIESFRSDIEQRLSRELGHQVTIGRLESRWIWLDPIVEADTITVVRERDQEQLGALRNLRIRLDTLASLSRLRLVFAGFDADGLDVTLRHTPEGEVEIKGAELPEPTEDRLARWIDLAGQWMSDPSVRITRVNLALRNARGNIRHVDIPQLDLIYLRGMLYASGRAMRSGTNQQLASFRLLGQHFFRGDFNGQVYLDVNSGRYFDGLLEDFHWRGLRIEGMELGGQAWFTFEQGMLDQVSGILETPYLQLGTEVATVAPLEDIRARVGWRRTAVDDTTSLLEQGQLHVKQLQWRWEDHAVEPFSLTVNSGADGWELAGDGLALEALGLLTQRLGFLPARARDALRNYSPAGYLDHWQLAIPGPGEQLFRFAGELRDVSVSAYAGAPGISNLDGTIVLDDTRGVVVADSRDLTLGFPKLFADSWRLNRAQATVAWSRESGITRVYSDDIQLQYREDTRLTGAFDLRLSGDNENNLGLKVGVEDGDAGMLADFVPYHVVDPGLYDWLTTAITTAHIEQGEYFGHGQIGAGSPPGSFNSAMWYRFRDAGIRYDEAWPPVTEARGEVRIHDGVTRVEIAGGETGGLSLQASDVRVEPGEEGATVHVRTGALVPGDTLPYWMENSPLGDMAGQAASSIEVEGETQLALDLAIPLADSQSAQVTAEINPRKTRVVYPQADLSWKSVEGRLTYSSRDGFSAEPLSSMFMDQPVQLYFETPPAGDGMAIRQTGTLDMPSLLAGAGLSSAALGVDGGAGYQAKLELREGREPDLSFSSDLSGVAIRWPAPLEKLAGQEAPFWATLDAGEDDEIILAGYWGDRLAFNLAWRDQVFHRGRIALQVPETTLPGEPGLVVSGPVERLELEPWQNAASRLAEALEGYGDSASEAAGPEAVINHLDLQIRELVMLGQSFSYVQLDGRPRPDGSWLVETRSPRATGRVQVPGDDSQPIVVEFSELKLARSENDGEAVEVLTVEQQLDAFRTLAVEDWPEIDVAVGNLQLDDEHLGRWSLQLRPEPGILRIQEIQGQLDSLTLRGEMRWSDATGREVSRFRGNLEGGGLEALNPLTESGIPFRNDETAIELDLDWPGRPDDFSLSRLNGNVSLRLDDGVILEQNNTAQLFRIFNLLNTDTLWRRLQFDFSDLYEAGVAFDAISGKASITEGLLAWDPELQVVGPSGAFKLSGTTNMAEEDLNMKLVVVLPLTQNLPLAALLLGAGAPIGGALFVLDKILGDPLSKLTSATYSVTGTWSEPEVDLQGVFGAGD